MVQTEEARLVEEYAEAAREHNERRMELIGAQLDALRAKGRMGRPVVRTEGVVKTSIELPVSVHQFLKSKRNRTAWIIQAIQEKREREEGAVTWQE